MSTPDPKVREKSFLKALGEMLAANPQNSNKSKAVREWFSSEFSTAGRASWISEAKQVYNRIQEQFKHRDHHVVFVAEDLDTAEKTAQQVPKFWYPELHTCLVLQRTGKGYHPVALFTSKGDERLDKWFKGVLPGLPVTEISAAAPSGSHSRASAGSSAFGVGENIIFYGPPGTGKSSRAEENAKKMGSEILRTLFHPEFTYADFIGSYRPVVGCDKTIKIEDRIGREIPKPVSYFEFVPGVLARALRKAFEAPDKHVVLLIDEINRGGCAAIFGDFFQLLDRERTGLSRYGINVDPELLGYLSSGGVHWDIVGDEKLHMPPNLSLFATMNTSDQSLYAMDAAFKRRWTWEPCHVDYADLKGRFKTRLLLVGDVTKEDFDWIELLKAINKRISRRRMEDKQIGPWFLVPDPSGKVQMRDFSNKCLFYLWHDVFKDDHTASENPFREDEDLVTFANLQRTLDTKGLGAILKDELMREIAPKASVSSEPEVGDDGSSSDSQ